MTAAAQTAIEAERVAQIACANCRKLLDVGHLPSFSQIKCPECGLSQIVPARFGGFWLIGKLGAGGMGVIYRAMDKELGRQVALKVMKRELGANEEFVRSFKHEAQAAAALNHPNVVQIYSFGQVEGQPYIAMELVSGGRLDEMIADGRALEETRALEIHLQVVAGLHAASEVGLVHGDIKPANILFGQNGQAKVVDFGLASFIGQQQQGGQVWGTPYYIAPEKARGQRVDYRSDIYSLGATLFHVLSGHPPFDGATPVDVVMARLTQPAPSLLTCNAELHPATAALVARMLEVEPTMRHPSYAALEIDIQAAYEAAWQPLKTATTRKTRLATALRPTPSPANRNLLIRSAIALLAVLLVAGGTLLWSAHHRQQQRRLAEAQQREQLQQAVAQGEVTFNQINNLAGLIIKLGEGLGPLEARINKQAAANTNQNTALARAALEIEKGLEIVNETTDTQALADTARQRLRDSTNFAAAQEAQRQLETYHTSLIERHNLIQAHQASAQEALAEAGKIQAQAATAARQARELAAQEAARKKAEEEARQLAAQQAAAAELERLKLVQAELDVIDAARGANSVLIGQRQFAQAAASLAKLKIAQPESQAYIQNITEAYQAMERLKEFIVEAVRNSPYPNGWITGSGARDIIKASANDGLTIALGAAGQVMVPWDQVTLTHLDRITNHYLETADLAPAVKGELKLALALICYESGIFKMAETYAEAAGQADPALKPKVQRLLPGFGEE
ncbi:MAG: protein kinase [Lentisphaerae bacterium]|nr:protein kinase [Lentisphaerota bacterium]